MLLSFAGLLQPVAVQTYEVPTERGVTLRVYQVAGKIEVIPMLATNQTPNFDELLPAIELPDAKAFPELPAPIVCHVRGYLQVSESGPYEFRLTSDDGARLTLDGELVLEHEGLHEALPKTSPPLLMDAGRHTLLIEHFDAGGERTLHLEWFPPGAPDFSAIPSEALSTDADPARVTSPGVKALWSDRRPGDGRELENVHPGFVRTPILPQGFEPRVGAMAFLTDGRLVLGTFDPLQRTDTDLPDIESKAPDRLYALSGVTTGDPERVKVSAAADGLYEPSGLCAVGERLYVSHRRAITELTDRDGDGFFETHRDVASGWEGWNYHQFTFGLLHREGRLYAALSTAMAPPKWEGMETNSAPNGPLRGSIIEVDLSSETVHAIAGGCRSPNGIGWGPEGAFFYCDNQGAWMPTSQIAEVVPGRFFGHYNNTNVVSNLVQRFPEGGHASAWCERLRAPAAVYLPQNELANSPSQPLLVDTGPYAGQLLVGEITSGGIRRVFLEKVSGVWQGAAFRFTQGLGCGINRLAWGPDGALYAGGIGGSGNWSWNDTRFGLERLEPTGRVAFEMLAVRATRDGLEIEFTRPVDAAWLADPAHYQVEQWRYVPTREYGGEKIDQRVLLVAGAEPSSDGRRVRLTIPGLVPGSCVHLRTDPTSLDGETIWSTEAWYTLNQVPPSERRATDPGDLGVGIAPPADAAVLIGRTGRNAMVRPSELEVRPTEGRTQAQILEEGEFVEVTSGSGDLISRTVFGDCRLHVEWFAPPGGEGQLAANSGVYLQDRYELQVLGTPVGDEPLGKDEAGAIYAVKPADENASTGPGTWQAYDVLFRAPRFESGTKTSAARVTVYWNGRLVHDDVELSGPTGAAAARGESADHPVQLGPLRLQDHESAAQGPVRFRNVWIASMEPHQRRAGPWEELFDGASLEGWVVRGGSAEFRVEDGEIVGVTRPSSSNTFLVSRRTYGDFELLLEFIQHPELNSGVQIRSTVEGGLEHRDGRVIGYQVELDPSARAYTGGLYDEGRRGWLYPLIDAPYARKAYRSGEWNRLRVVAEGPLVRTWINGVPAASAFDAQDVSGHLALQVHGVGERSEPLEVRFRNVRIRSLE